MDNIVKKIEDLKKKKNAIILAHSYQDISVDLVADYVGDSLYLSQKARDTKAEIIIFAGVYFMAQTAKIISPDKKVLLPNSNAGCLMADMLDCNKLLQFKNKYPHVPVVCYINSTAEVKALCDICCTSSNALEIVKSLGAPQVLFVPDANLGNWVNAQLTDVDVITYNGYCPIHNQVVPAQVTDMKKKYPDAKVLVHPECKQDVTALADYVGSTSGITNYVKNTDFSQYIIVTEKGVIDRLKKYNTQKEFYGISEDMVCKSMKLTTLEEILNSLESEQYEVELNEDVLQRSKLCIENMLKVSK